MDGHDESKKTLEDTLKYITELQQNFRLAVQKVEELTKEKQDIFNEGQSIIDKLSGEIDRANEIFANLQYDKRQN